MMSNLGILSTNIRGVDVNDGPNENVVPQLFYDGGCRVSVLMRQAYSDVGFCYFHDEIEEILGVPAFGLLARIRRYAEGRMLIRPEQINDEKDPFQAIKYAYCADRESFEAQGLRSSDLEHLRAYFWDEDSTGEALMCITHFIIKKQKKLDSVDTQISQRERLFFLESGCHYEDD